ncbi:MAG: CHASE domain-containing protein, partial [Pseudomonas sp.]
MNRNPAHRQLRTSLATLATFLLCASLSLGLWWNAWQEDRHAAQERFQFETREVQFAVQQRLLAYEHVLRGAVGLFAASPSVERDAWRSYVRNLHIEQNYPGIQGIGFAKWLTPAEREPLTRQVHAEGFPQFALWPQGERDVYSTILYLEPFDWRNQRAFGYDMYSEPTRRAAMDHARDLGRPAVSGRVKLVQETSEGVQHGFLLYLPVYPQGQVPARLKERRRQLQGFVYSPFRMNDLLRGILGPKAQSGIRLEIYDGLA